MAAHALSSVAAKHSCKRARFDMGVTETQSHRELGDEVCISIARFAEQFGKDTVADVTRVGLRVPSTGTFRVRCVRQRQKGLKAVSRLKEKEEREVTYILGRFECLFANLLCRRLAQNGVDVKSEHFLSCEHVHRVHRREKEDHNASTEGKHNGNVGDDGGGTGNDIRRNLTGEWSPVQRYDSSDRDDDSGKCRPLKESPPSTWQSVHINLTGMIWWTPK